MRQRLPVLALILVLATPAAGWAKGSEADPNGASKDLASQSTPTDPAGRSLFHLFVAWLEARLPQV